MEKDFDSWNKTKKIIQKRKELFCNVREVWWCSIGLNIGSEEDGKNDLYERPVLVIKVFNKNTIRVAPLTSKIKDDKNHIQILYQNRSGCVILSQIKTISTKRLSRKLVRLDNKQFNKVIEKIRESIF